MMNSDAAREAKNVRLSALAYLAALNAAGKDQTEAAALKESRAALRGMVIDHCREMCIALGASITTNPPAPPKQATPEAIANGIARNAERVHAAMMCRQRTLARVAAADMWLWVGGLT